MNATAFCKGHNNDDSEEFASDPPEFYYGISVVKAHRDNYFHRSWTDVAIEIDGISRIFKLGYEFWGDFDQDDWAGAILDNTTVISGWFIRHYGRLNWPDEGPWPVVLTPVGGNGFRLSPVPLKESGR